MCHKVLKELYNICKKYDSEVMFKLVWVSAYNLEATQYFVTENV